MILGPFLRTSRRSRCFGCKVHKCETWNYLPRFVLLHSVEKPYVVARNLSHWSFSWKVMLQQVTHSAAVVAPWNFSDKVLLRIFNSLYSAKLEITCPALLKCIPYGNPSLWPRKVMQMAPPTAAIVSFPYINKGLYTIQEVPLHFPMAKGLPWRLAV